MMAASSSETVLGINNSSELDESIICIEQIEEIIVISSDSDSEAEVVHSTIPDEPPPPSPAADNPSSSANNNASFGFEFDDEYSNLLDVLCHMCSELVPFGKGATIPGCNHSICANCVAKAILQGQTRCPGKELNATISSISCGSIIPTGLVRHVLPVEEFQMFQAQSLEALDDMDLVMNSIPFECPICLLPIRPGHGVVLRDCVHEFCLECLRQTVIHCEDVQVVCPFTDENYSCGAVMQQREVRGVLGENNAYDRHLTLCLKVAERRLSNTFHCKTRDCPGWCILENGQQSLLCPVCQAISCTSCEVIKYTYIVYIAIFKL